MVPDAALLARFAANLDRLSAGCAPIGVAVSGGPDSVALLLLAAAVRPGLVEAATVDHGLRTEARAEADWVAGLCRDLGVPHTILTVAWEQLPTTAIQERARAARYDVLGRWLRERRITELCTGHHQGDQAETLLMRLARGAGLRGLGAMRAAAPLPGHPDLALLRPLLSWSRAELEGICSDVGIKHITDPSNADDGFERVRVRRLLENSDLDPAMLAKSADHLAMAEESMAWTVDREWRENVAAVDGGHVYAPTSAPAEIRRRIVARAVAALATEGQPDLRGGELDRLIETLVTGGVATLRGVRCEGGPTWQFRPAPPRSSDRH